MHRLLRPGALFKFQVQGVAKTSGPYDTWHGVSFTEQGAQRLAESAGFEAHYRAGSNTQSFWLWFFQKP